MGGKFVKGMQKPAGSGRKRGQTHKVTEECRRLAKMHGPEVIKELARLALEAEDERARVMAGNSILDRAYGKASALPLSDESGSGGGVKIVITGTDKDL